MGDGTRATIARLYNIIRLNNNNDVPAIIPIYLMIIKMLFHIVWIIIASKWV